MWSAQPQIIHLRHSAYTQGPENFVEDSEV